MKQKLYHFHEIFEETFNDKSEEHLSKFGAETVKGKYREYLGNDRLIRLVKKDPELHSKFIEYNWVDKNFNLLPLYYKLDDAGFRIFDNSKEESIASLGCSYTYGMGVHLEQTWTYKLSRLLNKPAWNFGIPGASQDLNYETLLRYLPEKNISDLFWLIPESSRDNLIVYNKKAGEYIRVRIASNCEDRKLNHIKNYTAQDYFKDCRISNTKLFTDTQKNIDAVENICRRYNIRLHKVLNPLSISQSISDKLLDNDNNFFKVQNYEISYDMTHLGVPFHDTVADYFYKKFNQSVGI